MKAIRLANLASELANQAKSWAGSMDPEEARYRRHECDALKRAIRSVILNAPPHVVENATRALDQDEYIY